MTITEYPRDRLAAQPIGYWTGAANTIIVGGLRAALAEEALTQPHWWTLNHVAGAPGTWTRPELTRRLVEFDTQATDFEAVYADLTARGWMTESDAALTLTPSGEAALARATIRNRRVHDRMHEGIDTSEYIAALDVLRRMIDNLGGNSDLP